MAIGQEAIDDAALVMDWIEAGMTGDPLPGTVGTVLQLALYASLPDAYLDAVDMILDGHAVPGVLPPVVFQHVAIQAALAVAQALASGVGLLAAVRQIGPARLRRAHRVTEWISRLVGGLDSAPEALQVVGGVERSLRNLVANVPEAVVIPELLVDLDEPWATRLRALATETIDDWLDAAAGLAGLGRTLDLIAAATGGEGLTEADSSELAARYAELVGRAPRVRLSAAELAERTSPLLRLDLETQLTAMDAWPAERGAHVPLYARALLAAWTELTGERPPVRCKTPGCPRPVPAIRNREYCDTCQLERKRAGVRRSRSGGRSAGPERAG
jgi:hypothetical protein